MNLGEGTFNAPSAEAAVLTTQQTNANRAVAAYNALQKYFYVKDGTSLYRETYPWIGREQIILSVAVQPCACRHSSAGRRAGESDGPNRLRLGRTGSFQGSRELLGWRRQPGRV